MAKGMIIPDPTNLNNRKSQRMEFLVQKKMILAPKPKNSRQIFPTVEFKPSNCPSTNISNLDPRETTIHGGRGNKADESALVCYDRGLTNTMC